MMYKVTGGFNLEFERLRISLPAVVDEQRFQAWPICNVPQ
jgi:hypothetical protein